MKVFFFAWLDFTNYCQIISRFIQGHIKFTLVRKILDILLFSQFFYLLWSHRSCVHTATAALRSSSFLVAGLRPKTLGKMKTCVWDGLSTNLFTVCMCVRTDYYKLHILTWAQCCKIVHLRHLWIHFLKELIICFFSLVILLTKMSIFGDVM